MGAFARLLSQDHIHRPWNDIGISASQDSATLPLIRASSSSLMRCIQFVLHVGLPRCGSLVARAALHSQGVQAQYTLSNRPGEFPGLGLGSLADLTLSRAAV